MTRDHMLGWPGLLALIEPDSKPPQVTQPRVRVVPAVVADERAMSSDRPKPLVVGVDLAAGVDLSGWFIWRNGQCVTTAGGGHAPIATPQPDADGWIEHDGTQLDLPVDRYEVRFRDGDVTVLRYRGLNLLSDWSRPYRDEECDITHYRVVKS